MRLRLILDDITAAKNATGARKVADPAALTGARSHHRRNIGSYVHLYRVKLRFKPEA